MALRKVITFKGLSAEYWKIIGTRTDNINGITSVQLALYANETARRSNAADYLMETWKNFDSEDMTRAQIYAQLKNLDEFSSAEDC